MAIDRIGKGGAVPPSPEGAGGVSGPSAATPGFKVDRAATPEAATATQHASSVDASQATTPLARLRAGEIDVHGYIDLKVDEVTSKLHGLSGEELADIKSVLGDQLRTDPGLADLARTATGKMPSPPED